MGFRPTDLPWLPEPPKDLRKLCRLLSAEDVSVGSEVQRLATHRLDASQSAALSRAIARLIAAGADLAPLASFRLGVVSNTTFDFLADVLPAAAARHGVALDFVISPLDQVEQQAFDPRSEINAGQCDGVLVAVDHRWLGLDAHVVSGDGAGRVEAGLHRLREVALRFASHSASVILCSAGVPPQGLFGSYDRRFNGSVVTMVERFNAALPELCMEVPAVLFDVAGLVQLVGSAAWFDDGFYNLYKLPFSPDATTLYADALGRLVGALRGKARKCLVLDLDNTCWGGVIGDEGLEGIRIGVGSPEGEAFVAVQQAALTLKSRGVVLAVSSKNDDQVARGPFRDHPDMLLKETDIAVFQANWEDKPRNLEAIARTLEIGLDALVFLDDNSAERAQVRAALPMVAVPELPADPAFYAATLLNAGYFEAVGFSEEDRLRSDSYAANAQRAEILGRARDAGDYLRALEMRISHAPFDALNRSRIAQLINKSNQFNLTTRRYTEAQVAELERTAAFTLQTRLADRFGDFGMIGVIVAHACELDGEAAWEVDTWLMSCRVLGRKVEEAMLEQLAEAARGAGVRKVSAQYLPTAKNGMVREHFDKLGFRRVREEPDGRRIYELEVADFAAEPGPFVSDEVS